MAKQVRLVERLAASLAAADYGDPYGRRLSRLRLIASICILVISRRKLFPFRLTMPPL